MTLLTLRATPSTGMDWYKFQVTHPYRTLRAGRGYYFEVRHAMHKAGDRASEAGYAVVKLCIRQPAGVNYSLPSTVGAANYHWEDLEHGTRAAFQYGGTHGKTGLFDLTCADGYSAGQGANGVDPNATKIIESSPDWYGSHAIMPVPPSFFRTNYTPTFQEVLDSNRSVNIKEENVAGVGGHGGTCTCPDGAVYQVGDNYNSCNSLACIGGVWGTCSSNNPGGGHVRVTCAPPSPPAVPPSPPPTAEGLASLQQPTPTSLWGARQPGGVAALTDGATGSCSEVRRASVFWGFSGVGSDDDPDFGSECSAEELIGTPCAPSVAPTRRYNLLLVRSGAAAYAGRVGLSQRRWRFDRDEEASSLYQAAGLLQKAEKPDGDPNWFEWSGSPMISEASITAAYPTWTNSYISSHPDTSAAEPYIPNRWMDDKKWLQISTGYFVPPVTGLYLFSVFSRTADKGDAYVVLSTGADGQGAYFAAFGSHWHDQKLSRWLALEQGKHYYLEFWQDYFAPDHWNDGGLSSFAVRLALTDASGSAVHIPQAVSELGVAETGSANCQDDESKNTFCFTGGTAGEGLMTNQNNWRLFDTRTCVECGLDWMWKENILFDPIPSAFLRHSGTVPAVETLHPGGRGALRRWWGWTQEHCVNPATGAMRLDEAWNFPWAMWPGQSEPQLLDPLLLPNGTEVISSISTPRTPEFKGLQCYAETISAYFRPKRTARYQFKLWSNDNKFARLYFNPQGSQPAGAIEVAASRSTKKADRAQPWDAWNPGCQACAGRARSQPYELIKDQLYFLRIYHAG